MPNHIDPSARINEGKVIFKGENIYIGANCSIGFAPEHKEIDPREPSSYTVVIIEDNVRIMNGVNIDAGYKEPTEIGEGSIIMAHSHVGHDCKIGRNCIVSSGTILGGHTILEDNVNTGINSTTHQFTHIKEGTILGAGSFAKGTLEPFCKYYWGKKAEKKGENTYQLERKKRQTPPDISL